jgi:mRNA-degrading endonuclease RelE of RelBE toxin-antitoxin system
LSLFCWLLSLWYFSGSQSSDPAEYQGKNSIVIWPERGHTDQVVYRIVLTENAIEDFNALEARWRTTVRDAMRIHLTHEPTKQSKSRIKRLRDLRHPQFRLRVESLRVFYDVIDTDVVIIAIMPKEKTTQWLEEHGEK